MKICASKYYSLLAIYSTAVFLSLFTASTTFAVLPDVQATAEELCIARGLKTSVENNEHHPVIALQKIEDLDQLLLAFTQGLSPDLANPAQRHAFEIYRRMRFGDPNTNLNPTSMEDVAKIIRAHPELEKETFRDYKIERQERIYPVSKELSSFIDSQVSSAGQVRSNLFQVEANQGFWKKVLQYKEPQEKLAQLPRDATDEQRAEYRVKAKELKDQALTHWSEFLNKKIPPSLRKELSDPNKSVEDRGRTLYAVLKAERERLLQEKADIRLISQAMVDLVHTIGYGDPAVTKAFASPSGMERLNAYRKVLDERDRFAMSLG